MDPITIKNMKEYDAHAQEWHQAIPENVGHRFLEKPAMEQKLPDDLTGMNVLCIGVGSGEELAKIIDRHPQTIVGIDISKKLLKIAQKNFPQVQLLQMDMTALQFPEDTFDFVYSSLTFHYAKDWDQLLSGIMRVLKKNGRLLCSTHNPKFWAQFPKTVASHVNARGIQTWEYNTLLPGNVKATYYNVADKTIIEEALQNAGFMIEEFYHPKVTMATEDIDDSVRERYLKLKEQNEAIPLFLIIKAYKGSARSRYV